MSHYVLLVYLVSYPPPQLKGRDCIFSSLLESFLAVTGHSYFE